MEIQKIKSYRDIFGWFDFEQVYDLVISELQSEYQPSVCEVGCFMGKSTAYLLSKIRETGKEFNVYVVDTFKGTSEYHHSIINDRAEICRRHSCRT